MKKRRCRLESKDQLLIVILTMKSLQYACLALFSLGAAKADTTTSKFQVQVSALAHGGEERRRPPWVILSVTRHGAASAPFRGFV